MNDNNYRDSQGDSTDQISVTIHTGVRRQPRSAQAGTTPEAEDRLECMLSEGVGQPDSHAPSQNRLSASRCKSEGRTAERARDLISSSGGDDETRRAAFAPENRRISREYDEAACLFFRFCRGPMSIRAPELAQWVLNAKEAQTRAASLRYLLEGELAGDVRKHLRNHGMAGTWLKDPDAHLGLPDDLLEPLYEPVLARPQYPVALSVTRDPRAILERISEWWNNSCTRELSLYNRRVYPGGKSPRLTTPWEGDFNRSEWLVLFTRAAFYRLGRAGDQQHRNYIEYVQNRGWWEVFSAERPRERAHEWMGVLDEFHDDQVDEERWEHWMRCFPAIYKLACRLEQYAEIFLDLDRETCDYDLESRINSRIDEGRGGGGIEAPPPSLGIGSCFVVRELLRMRKINNEYAHEHAFVPTGAVRGLLERIGLAVDNGPDVSVSAQIYEQVAEHIGRQRATFGMAFDIPFQIISADPELAGKLLTNHAPIGGRE